MSLNRENSIHSLSDNKIENHFGIRIQEIAFSNKINIRINPKSHHMSICGKILDALLPLKPNTYSENQSVKIIWLGPDEWIMLDNSKNINDNLFKELNTQIGDYESSVTDITETKTIIRISGEKIYTLLSKFLVLDLENNFKTESSCAQTLFVKVPIILLKNHKNSNIPEIDIIVNRSHAKYVYDLLIDGSQNLNF